MRGTIFMVHGMYSAAWVWGKYLSFFEDKGWSCLTPTLRHHEIDPEGPPPPELASTSLLDYAADLEKEILNLEKPPVIMGHSMGGLLAQMLAAKGLAKAAVLLTPAAPAGILALNPSVIRCFWSVMTAGAFWKKSFRPSYENARWAFLEGFSEEEGRKIWEKLVWESGRAVFEIGMWPLDKRHAARVDPQSVNIPLLIISGGRDRATPAGIVRKVAARYGSRATYRNFENDAHWVLAQRGWETIAETVAQWLASLD